MQEDFEIEITPNFLNTGCFLGSRLLEARPDNVNPKAWQDTIISFAQHVTYFTSQAIKDDGVVTDEVTDLDKFMIHLETYLPR